MLAIVILFLKTVASISTYPAGVTWNQARQNLSNILFDNHSTKFCVEWGLKSLMEHTGLTASDFYHAKWLLSNAQIFCDFFSKLNINASVRIN